VSSAPSHVRTGSRIHLGLLSLPGRIEAASFSPRSFGGVGLMIDEPAVCLSVEAATQWRADGPHAQRALEFATRAAAGRSGGPLCVRVEECPDEHVGLGTGTQLAMAVAMGVRLQMGVRPDCVALAAEVGRGLRSGLGVHGFAQGGFLVDGGKGPSTAVAPLVCRHEFPAEWRVLLVTPRHERGLAGDGERDAFAKLANESVNLVETENLCRLVLLGIVPALIERDLPAFGDAVFEFNRRAGLLFKGSQGGEYRSPATAALVSTLRGFGIRGVGQSSWGPTIFAIGEGGRLEDAAERLRRAHGDDSLEMRVTSARNRGWAE
jgi:beta-ribofuranosylaminobenzene 5'-phosphate synthase